MYLLMTSHTKHERDTKSKMLISEDDILINTYPVGFSPQFSIVLPVHNEGNSIEKVVMNFYEELKNDRVEIILSEDGSKDNTKQVIQQLSTKIPLKALLSNRNKGYGIAIKDGLRMVSAPFVLFSDSDGQHKPKDFWKMKTKLEELNYSKNVIICGKRIVRADAFHRRVMSKVFQSICTITFDLPPLGDITAGFKMMNTDLAKKIMKDCKYMIESFWTEVLIRAHHNEVQIVEVSVQHREREYGETVVYKKSKIPKIVYSQLMALITIKKELTGKSFLTSLLETKFFKQMISFAIVGASGAGIILFLTWLGVQFGLHYILSAAIGIELSILWAFTLNNKVTFKEKIHESKLSHKFLKYHVTALSGEGLNLVILYGLTNNGIFYLLSEAIAILLVFVFNFTLSKKWVWK